MDIKFKMDYDEAQLCDSTELQQESTDRPVSIGQIPLLSNLPGDYGFSFTLKRTPGNKTTWEYSDKHNQLFIDMNKVVTVQFVYQTTKPLSERLFIRALPVYCSTDFIGMPVNRCSIHSAEDDPTQRAHSGIMCHCFMYNNAGHVVRCETSGAFYDFDIQSKRHSVVIPIPNVRQAGNYYDATYTFACKTSCQKGMQRRPINVVFTLENCGGDVLGRCSLGVKICSCPKRDKDKLEKNGERHSKKNSKMPISQDDEDQGAVPAVIGILDGQVKIGLNTEEITRLADPKTSVVKTSRRDFPYVIANKLNGGTTVSGTLLVADSVGIKVFATGGIGGVHRNGEVTMDVSADLIELGRHPVMVVSSGVKSILDIKRTLEYLETEGVCVTVFGTDRQFPAFYTIDSGQLAPYNVTEPFQAAKLLKSCVDLKMNSGILLAVPVPVPFAMNNEEMESAVSFALKEAETQQFHGKEVTPFVLNKVSELTSGKSLRTNIELVKNNAKIASQIAVEYYNLNIPPLSFDTFPHAGTSLLGSQEEKAPV